MPRRDLVLAVLALLVLAVPSARGSAVPRHLTLDAAEHLLAERNLPTVAARQGVDIARAQKLVAASSPVPSVSYGQNLVTMNDHRNPDNGEVFYAPSPLWNMGVGLSYLIERGGKLEFRTRIAESQLQAAEAQVLDTMRLQLGQLRQSFTAALLARENLYVALTDNKSLDETERLLAARVERGMSPEGDLVRFKANRLQYDTNLAAARTAYELACRDLLNTMGATVRDIEAGEAGEEADELRDFPLLVVGKLAWRAKPLDIATLRSALDHRPDVVVAARAVDAAHGSVDLAKAAESSDVSIGASVGRSRSDSTLGISLSIPIFTGPLVERQVMVAVGQHEQAVTQNRQVRLQAETDFEKAVRTLQLSETLVHTYSTEALARAEEAYGITFQAYQRGSQSLIDVLDAQRTLSQTRVAVNQSRSAYLAGLFQLEQAAGVDGLVELDTGR